MKVSVLSAQQQPFVNDQYKKPKQVEDVKGSHEKQVSVELVNSGDVRSKSQADMIFQRANAYAKLSMQAQRMLSGYEGVVLNERKESIRKMLGVDLYA